MKVTVQNLTQNLLSTDVGLLNPGESRSLDMNPLAAYRAAEGLKTLADAGKVSVTILEEANKLDSLEPAAVGTASVADGAVTSAKLAAGAVAAGKIAVGGVSAADQFAAGVVDAAALASAAVTKAKAKVFASTEQTATGSAQNVAHGLGATPALVMVSITESDGSAFDIAEGAHDGTNVVVTITAGAKFKVLAWA